MALCEREVHGMERCKEVWLSDIFMKLPDFMHIYRQNAAKMEGFSQMNLKSCLSVSRGS